MKDKAYGNTKEPMVKDTGRQMEKGEGGLPEQTNRKARGAKGSESRPQNAWYGEDGGVPKSRPVDPAGNGSDR